MYKKRSVAERFHEKVNKADSGCHEWTSCLMPNGYGQISVNRRAAYAHRVAWELANGPIPEGAYVLHTCDNRKCVNPDHLFIGTFDENMADMVRKNRQASGDRNGRRKLSSTQVKEIRAMVATQGEIARHFGVSQGIVSMIRSRRVWRNI